MRIRAVDGVWGVVPDDLRDEMLTQPQNVLEWRYDCFMRMGFDDKSFALALTNIDLHVTQNYLDAGCTHELAIECLRDEELWVGDNAIQDPN